MKSLGEATAVFRGCMYARTITWLSCWRTIGLWYYLVAVHGDFLVTLERCNPGLASLGYSPADEGRCHDLAEMEQVHTGEVSRGLTDLA